VILSGRSIKIPRMINLLGNRKHSDFTVHSIEIMPQKTMEETGASYLSAQDLRNAGAKHRNGNNPDARDAPQLAADSLWRRR
jgi:hypothetical protein